MPAIRDYTQFDTIESTDAFVVDRAGVGTGYVEGVVVVTPAPTGVVAGSYTLTNLTVNEFGQITVASDGAGGAGLPGGLTTQVQYNHAGVFGGITGATTDGTTLSLIAPNLGTPATGTLTNCTSLPLSTGVTGNLAVTHLNGGTSASSSTFWRGDGTWATPSGGGGSPGGSNTQVQYNNSGAFAGSSGITLSATQATLVAPILGTPASGTLTNCTALPLTTGVTGNLAPAHLNSGTSASSVTFWRGDGTWATPTSAAFSPYWVNGTLVTPSAGSFTATAQSGISVTWADLASGRGATMKASATGNTMAIQAAANASAVTVTALVMFAAAQTGTLLYGPCIVDGSGNIASFAVESNWPTSGLGSFIVYTRAGINSGSGSFNTVYTANSIGFNSPVWLKMQLSGANILLSISYDGETFSQVGSVAKASYLPGTGTAASVGVFMDNATSFEAYANLYSFTNATP